MITIYCWNYGGPEGFLLGFAMTESGHVLTSHVSSDQPWLQFDLGLTSDRKHDIYDAKCGKGNWRLEWVSNTKQHPGFQMALDRNKALAVAKAQAD